MGNLNFNVEALRAIDRAATNPQDAAHVLRIAAGYLRRKEHFTDEVAEYLAAAFEAALKKPEGKQRNNELLAQLNLKRAAGPRPSFSFLETMGIGRKVASLMPSKTGLRAEDGRVGKKKSYWKRDAAIAEIATQSGLLKSQVAHSYRQYQKAMKEVAAVNAAEDED